MAYFLTNRGMTRIAEVGWPNLSLLAALMTDAYVPDRDHNVMSDIVAFEYPGSARQTLSGLTVTQDNTTNRAVLGAGSVPFGAVAPSGLLEMAAMAVIEDGANDGVRNVILIVAVPSTAPTGAGVVVQFSSDGAAELLT